MPRVEFQNIVKQYGRLTLLDDLDLTVEDGTGGGRPAHLGQDRSRDGQVRRPRQDVRVSFPADKLNVFDARSGRRM